MTARPPPEGHWTARHGSIRKGPSGALWRATKQGYGGCLWSGKLWVMGTGADGYQRGAELSAYVREPGLGNTKRPAVWLRGSVRTHSKMEAPDENFPSLWEALDAADAYLAALDGAWRLGSLR